MVAILLVVVVLRLSRLYLRLYLRLIIFNGRLSTVIIVSVVRLVVVRVFGLVVFLRGRRLMVVVSRRLRHLWKLRRRLRLLEHFRGVALDLLMVGVGRRQLCDVGAVWGGGDGRENKRHTLMGEAMMAGGCTVRFSRLVLISKQTLHIN